VTEVLTAVGHQWESLVATTLERVPGVAIARRCADVAELLSVSEAGLGTVAVVSADVRGLDLEVVKRLRDRRIRILGLYPPDDEHSERRLHQLSVDHVLPFDATLDQFTRGLDGGGTDDTLPHAGIEGATDGVGAPWARDGVRGGALPGEAAGGLSGRAADGLSGQAADGPAGMPPAFEAEGWLPSDGSDRGRHRASLARRSGRGGPGEPVRRGPERATVIAIWGPTGAPGRTTVATTLAAELSSRGADVLLLDADTYGGSIAQALGLLDEAPGIAAACRAADQGTLDLPSLSRLAPEVVPGLRVLTGVPKAERWLEVRAAALERVLDLGRTLVDVVVADCGFCIEDDEELSYDTLAPRRNEATLTCLAASDTVVAVGGADPVALQRFVRALQELGTVPSGEPVPVVNRVRASAVGSHPEARIADSMMRFAGIDRLRFVPDDPDTVDGAVLAGRSIVEHAPGSRIRTAVGDLATAIAPWTSPAEPPRSRGRPAWARRSRNGRRRGIHGDPGDARAADERLADGDPAGSRRSRRVRT
jgi:MinD-like ATPase involved in chromosome partitioning or flagellar assembly